MAKKEDDVKKLETTEFFANYFNLTQRRVQQMAQEGVIPYLKKEKGNYYFEPEKTIKTYINFLQNALKNKSKEKTEKDAEKLDIDIRLKEVKLKKALMEFKELEGSLHRSEDVEDFTNDLVFTIRSLLMAIPSRLSDSLINISEEQEVNEILKNEVKDVLTTLSQYNYDPEAYAEKTKKRNKLELINEDDVNFE